MKLYEEYKKEFCNETRSFCYYNIRNVIYISFYIAADRDICSMLDLKGVENLSAL